MRLIRLASIYLIIVYGHTVPTSAERIPTFDSDCTAWADAVRAAGAKPPLELLIDEVFSGTYKPPDLGRLRSIAAKLYEQDVDIHNDFPTAEDYVQWNIEQNTKQPMDYAEHYQYRITITSNRFLVTSTNTMKRHDHVYHAVAGTKNGRQYNVVSINNESGTLIKSTWSGGVNEYVEIFQYGALSSGDATALETIWKIVTDKTDDALWQELCAGGGMLEVKSKGLRVMITNDVLDAEGVVRIECGTDDGRGAKAFVIDKADGRVTMVKEERNVEGIKRVRCSDFAPVTGSGALYPRTIVEEEYDPAGTPVTTRALTVRSVVALTDDDLRRVDWDLLNAVSTEGVPPGASQ